MVKEKMPEEFLKLVSSILTRYSLCDSCLGRLFSRLGGNISNTERGNALKRVLSIQAHLYVLDGYDEGLKLLEVLRKSGFVDASAIYEKFNIVSSVEKCYICNDLMSKIPEIADRISKKLIEYEFDTFMVGSVIPKEFIEREDQIRSEFSLVHGESIKLDFNRQLGRILEIKLNKVVDFNKPDITIVYNATNDGIEISLRPVYVYGRYLKLVRGLSQTRQFCPYCNGKGCEHCNSTGFLIGGSVEDYLVPPIVQIHEGSKGVLHAGGREDIDVRTLGTGRPFVVEVKDPKKRRIDLNQLYDIIEKYSNGKIIVKNLCYVDRSIVRKINVYSRVHEKRYRLVIKFQKNNLTEDIIAKIKGLSGGVIRQRTPRRVLHRRVDKERLKRVYNIIPRLIDEHTLELDILCQGGLYVKEFATSDEGRTKPSIAEVVGEVPEIVELDVIEIAPYIERQLGLECPK
jgi:tRNA pseudouridine synthase 10